MSGTLVARLRAASRDEKRRIVRDLIPAYADALVGDDLGTIARYHGDYVVNELPKMVARDSPDDEILDELGRWRFLGHAPTLRQQRAVAALLAAVRGDLVPRSARPDTPEGFLALWDTYGTQQAAAASVGLGKSQWRRKAGLDR